MLDNPKEDISAYRALVSFWIQKETSCLFSVWDFYQEVLPYWLRGWHPRDAAMAILKREEPPPRKPHRRPPHASGS